MTIDESGAGIEATLHDNGVLWSWRDAELWVHRACDNPGLWVHRACSLAVAGRRCRLQHKVVNLSGEIYHTQPNINVH